MELPNQHRPRALRIRPAHNDDLERLDIQETFDYVVVVGGLLHSGTGASDATLQFIRRAATTDATLVGICTGGVIGAVVGLYVGDEWERRHRRRRINALAHQPRS